MRAIDLSDRRAQWTDIENRPPVYAVFPIWAEENADLGSDTSGGFQWSFGNGNTTPSGTGVCLPFACELIGLTICIERADTVTVEAHINATASGRSVATTNTKTGVATFEANPLPLAVGDVLNFQTIAPARAANSDGGVVTAWLRRHVA